MFDPPIAPPYASMVIVELFFREIDEQHFVKFSYRYYVVVVCFSGLMVNFKL